jgi:hypothetical protein
MVFKNEARTTRPAGRPSRGFSLAESRARLPDWKKRQGLESDVARQICSFEFQGPNPGTLPTWGKGGQVAIHGG